MFRILKKGEIRHLHTILRAIILISNFCACGFHVETVKMLIEPKVRAKRAKK